MYNVSIASEMRRKSVVTQESREKRTGSFGF
jgi:hypothetical protein